MASGVKASVVLITYNHERFIAEALESVLSQRTGFPFEIIVSEDCSTDRTAEIAEGFRAQHPDRFRLIRSSPNVGDNTVVSRGILAAQGEYIALLDGDDYWSSPDKLQKQVNFLDERPDCSICFHNVRVLYEGREQAEHPFHLSSPKPRLSSPVPKATSQLVDLVTGNFIQTCSVMLRAGVLQGIPDWYAGLPLGDWPLYVLYAEHGDIGYLDEVLSTYRIHQGGWWSEGFSRFRDYAEVREMLRTYDVLDAHLGGRYHDRIRRAAGYLHRRAVLALLAERRFGRAFRHWRMYAASNGIRKALCDKPMARAAARGLRPARSDTRPSPSRTTAGNP